MKAHRTVVAIAGTLGLLLAALSLALAPPTTASAASTCDPSATLCDDFGDGSVATNTDGIGSGWFVSATPPQWPGTTVAVESDGHVTVSGQKIIHDLQSNDAVNPVGATQTWVVDGIAASGGYDGVHMGWGPYDRTLTGPGTLEVAIRQDHLWLNEYDRQTGAVTQLAIVHRGDEGFPGVAFQDPIADAAHPVTVVLHTGPAQWHLDVTGGYGLAVHAGGAYPAGASITDLMGSAKTMRPTFGGYREYYAASFDKVTVDACPVGAILCDSFDDGSSETNAYGTGTGWWKPPTGWYGTTEAVESGGSLNLSGYKIIHSLQSNDAIDPVGTTQTWDIDSIPASGGYDGVQVGWAPYGVLLTNGNTLEMAIRQDYIWLNTYDAADTPTHLANLHRGDPGFPGTAFRDTIADPAHPVRVVLKTGSDRWQLDVTGGYGIDVHEGGAWPAGLSIADLMGSNTTMWPTFGAYRQNYPASFAKVSIERNDDVAPTSSATLSGATSTFGIHDGTVNVDVTGDDGLGTGVKEIHWSSTGAQAAGETVVAGSKASIPVSALGTSTVTYWAVDRAGNVGASHTETVTVDNRPVVSISPDASALEPDTGGQRGMYFQFTLSKPAPAPVTVRYYTRDGTATGCTNLACDYGRSGSVANPQSFTIPAGATTATLGLNINSDNTVDPDESFDVVVASVSANAIVGQGLGTGHIIDVDGLSAGGKPVLMLTPKNTVVEGDGANAKAQVLINLSKPLTAPLEVTVRSEDLDAIGKAACGTGGDYRIVAPQVLTLPAGTLSKTVDIAVCNDTVVNGNRSFQITHLPTAAPAGNELVDVQAPAVVEIIDDDA
ncbi:MAG: Calx-beta domain-containing protein [Acidimicrobiales bacterium]